MSKAAIEEYAEAIENYFGQKRGACLIISPLDFAKVREWFEKGIPLRAVKKGIDRHFEKIEPENVSRAVVLRFAEGAILSEWEFMRTQGVSEAGRRRSPEDEEAERKERLGAFCEKCREKRGSAEWAGPLFDQLIESANMWQGGYGDHLELADMAEILEGVVNDFIRKNAPPERMRSARLTAEKALAPYKPRMNEETYREVLEANTLDALRTELGIPNILEEA